LFLWASVTEGMSEVSADCTAALLARVEAEAAVENVGSIRLAKKCGFKIEGRKRSPEYAAKTVSVYGKGIDLYFENKLDKEVKKELLAELGTVYNRGFSTGFYFDTPSSEDYADTYGSKATTRKDYVGKVLNYYKKANAVFIQIETGKIEVSDNIMIIGPTSGVVEINVENIIKDDNSVPGGEKGDRITFPCSQLVRPHDTVYKIVNI